ncbi:PAS domain-containing sensor histidine kinase [Marivita sp.]|uniref:PAS domain-containing sensor histidine kinase n=1 Tax=Marivita sp. TaxID=2003365 RepID=UPI003F6FA06B
MKNISIQPSLFRSYADWSLIIAVAVALFFFTHWILNFAPEIDQFSLASAAILLATAAIASILNVMRSNRVRNRLEAKSRAITLHERALEEHTIVSLTDRNGNISAINQKFTDTFGYESHEIIGKTPRILYGSDVDQKAYDNILMTIMDGKVWSGCQRLRDKFGKNVIVQTTIFPKLDEYGNINHLVSIRTDVSAVLADSEEQGRKAVLEALPDGVFIYDPDTFKLSYANKTFRLRTGWTDDDLHAKSIMSLFGESDLHLFKRYIDPLLKGEVPIVVFEFEHQTGPVEVLTHLVEDVDGKRNLVSVVRDISERKQAEQLKLSSVSTVSHELRTPLTSIKGALRLLESGVMGELSPDVSRLIGVAHRNSERLLAIVNDILTLEKLQSGDLGISTQDVDLRDILNEAAEANAPYANECKVAFVVETPNEAALAKADPDRLIQVMSNLMSNAAKLSPEGADVTLRLIDRGDTWRICIEDRGPGIPEDARDTLFDSFIQVENRQSKAFPSTGLGLTICREIVQRHGGWIAFDTEVGQGTTFYFELEKHTSVALDTRMLMAV